MTSSVLEREVETKPWYECIEDINSGVIFIAGPTCSGKTTLSFTLKSYFEQRHIGVTIIKQDDYYKDIRDIPWSYKGYLTDVKDAFYLSDMVDDFKKYLKNGKAEIPVYDMIAHKRVSQQYITKSPITIVEGLHTIATFYGLIDAVYLYMDVPTKTCAELRAERDWKNDHIKKDDSIIHFIECIGPFYEEEVFSQKYLNGVISFVP